MRSRTFGALGESRFRLLWAGQALSAVGDSLLPVALAFAVIELTGSASDLGLVLASALVPRVAFLVIGGVWADRLPRQLVMLASDLVRALGQAFLALVFITDAAELWHLLLGGLVYGTAQAFFGPASTGLVPETVSAGRLQQANALMSLTRSALFVGGPALAGLLVVSVGPGWVFAIDAATFVASAAFLALLSPGWSSRPPSRRPFGEEVASGWRELRSRSWVWASVLYFSAWNLAIAPFFVLGPIVAERELDGASDWGLILAGSGLGAIFGGATALRLRPSRPLLVGFLLITVSALQPASLIRPFPTLAITAATVAGVTALTISNTLWLTSLQEHIPRDALSRVSSYDWMVSLVFMPLGYVLAGPLAEAVGIEATLAGAAVVLAGASLAVLAVPSVRQLRRVHPEMELRPV